MQRLNRKSRQIPAFFAEQAAAHHKAAAHFVYVGHFVYVFHKIVSNFCHRQACSSGAFLRPLIVQIRKLLNLSRFKFIRTGFYSAGLFKNIIKRVTQKHAENIVGCKVRALHYKEGISKIQVSVMQDFQHYRVSPVFKEKLFRKKMRFDYVLMHQFFKVFIRFRQGKFNPGNRERITDIFSKGNYHARNIKFGHLILERTEKLFHICNGKEVQCLT